MLKHILEEEARSGLDEPTAGGTSAGGGYQSDGSRDSRLCEEARVRGHSNSLGGGGLAGRRILLRSGSVEEQVGELRGTAGLLHLRTGRANGSGGAHSPAWTRRLSPAAAVLANGGGGAGGTGFSRPGSVTSWAAALGGYSSATVDRRRRSSFSSPLASSLAGSLASGTGTTSGLRYATSGGGGGGSAGQMSAMATAAAHHLAVGYRTSRDRRCSGPPGLLLLAASAIYMATNSATTPAAACSGTPASLVPGLGQSVVEEQSEPKPAAVGPISSVASDADLQEAGLAGIGHAAGMTDNLPLTPASTAPLVGGWPVPQRRRKRRPVTLLGQLPQPTVMSTSGFRQDAQATPTVANGALTDKWVAFNRPAIARSTIASLSHRGNHLLHTIVC
ncbi:unnamed protein product [Protopolystoma xenopodis]|uniref:Uncharacterized protein n=1 Tax=Protopolystoma xenopodis TaxID=117903 RepID=A0A3S5CHT0_9PLAT|nr:unnamed protein product [Protopolystoma xenopodis]